MAEGSGLCSPGLPASSRCSQLYQYFIPDGRHDPYGKIKIQAGLAHQKTLHLTPFLAGTQRRADALGLVIYRDTDVSAGTAPLESHFVMPGDADEIRIGERRVEVKGKEPFALPVKGGEAVAVRRGGAVAGIKVPWTRDAAGQAAPVHLVWDGNAYGVLRLTVDHRWSTNAATRANAGAAFWIRIGSGLNRSNALDQWLQAFASTRCDVTVQRDRVQVKASGVDGSVAVATEATV